MLLQNGHGLRGLFPNSSTNHQSSEVAARKNGDRYVGVDGDSHENPNSQVAQTAREQALLRAKTAVFIAATGQLGLNIVAFTG